MTNEEVLYIMASAKWAYGFRCKSCKHRHCYFNKVEWKATCKKCRTKESALQGTALQGLKMPVKTALDILMAVQYHFTSTNTRMTMKEIGVMFNLNPNSVSRFFIRIAKHFEEGDVCNDEFESGLKNPRNTYIKIYNIIFEVNSFNGNVPLEEKDVLYALAKKEFVMLDFDYGRKYLRKD